jgi:hypothetical protein
VSTSFIDEDGNHILPDHNAGYKGTPTFASSKISPFHSNDFLNVNINL